jgi:hypothetical protein
LSLEEKQALLEAKDLENRARLLQCFLERAATGADEKPRCH